MMKDADVKCRIKLQAQDREKLLSFHMCSAKIKDIIIYFRDY